MIYCVWYPSGGFGHFVNAVLTLHGDNFKRPNNSLTFSKNGNSHSLDLVVPKWLHGRWPGNFEFDPDKNYSVLIDNGINDERDDFKKTFADAVVIKICYSDHSWPVVARTMIEKAMNRSLDSKLPIDSWTSRENWAVREKYFLYLRDHDLRQRWRPNSVDNTLLIEHMFDYNQFRSVVSEFTDTQDFQSLWSQWRQANTEFIDPVISAKGVIAAVDEQQNKDLSNVTDLWTQAIVYYYIWLKFEFEVPHNDYSNWFENTKDIITMLDKYEVHR